MRTFSPKTVKSQNYGWASLLEIRKIPAANLFPAIFLPPLLIALANALSPGILLGR